MLRLSESLNKAVLTLEIDNINHPTHYTQGEIETINIIKNNVRDFSSYLEGNVLKYLSRYRHKGGAEDLKKAQWYLKILVEEESRMINEDT